uniref:Integrase catalytic domain-containing protein n=1 Tax=Trichuris muris TaxID=70415 RepID=A0A5S6QXU1_TRIMR
MAPLPVERLRAFSPPFSCLGIDYFGPFSDLVRRRYEKRYGCLFTCLNSRAVHIEISALLDTDSFLMAFRRFIGRRGTPAVVYSDNGTNLVAAERELRTCLNSWNQQRIEEVFFQRRIRWKFSPPTAPHFGGVWERLVRSSKVALKKVLNGQAVSDEMLSTAMVEIESLMNSRPLTHIPIDPREPEPLTPNHFLLGRSHPHIQSDLISETEITSKRKWRAAQAIVERFWNRWQREYVPYLLERRRWVLPTRNLWVDDIVLVIDPQNPLGHWVLGRVTECKPGQDGTVRVKTNRGTYVRPVTKLCLMETTESDVSEDRSETGPAMLPIPRLSTESLTAINQNEGEQVKPELA